MFQKLQPDSSNFRLGPDFVQALAQRFELLLRDLVDVGAGGQGVGKLFLDGVEVFEEGSVVLDLLVQDGGRLLVELHRDVVGVDKSFALVQPLTYLPEFSRQSSVQLPAPVTSLIYRLAAIAMLVKLGISQFKWLVDSQIQFVFL